MRIVYFFHRDQQLAELYRRLFEDAGFRFRQATERQACMTLLEDESPHCIIMSLLVDRAIGFGFLEELLNRFDRNIPIVVYTKLSEREDVRRSRSLGCSGYFIESQTKPEELLKTVQTLSVEAVPV